MRPRRRRWGWGWRGRGADGACAVSPPTRRGGGDSARLFALMKRLQAAMGREETPRTGRRNGYQENVRLGDGGER